MSFSPSDLSILMLVKAAGGDLNLSQFWPYAAIGSAVSVSFPGQHEAQKNRPPNVKCGWERDGASSASLCPNSLLFRCCIISHLLAALESVGHGQPCLTRTKATLFHILENGRLGLALAFCGSGKIIIARCRHDRPSRKWTSNVLSPAPLRRFSGFRLVKEQEAA
jgi:hypothetical protein